MDVRNVLGPQWRLIYDHGLLVLSAGADRLYALDGVTEKAASEVIRWSNGDGLDDAELSPAACDVVARIADCGLVDRDERALRVDQIELRWAGEQEPELEGRVTDLLRASDRLAPAHETADMILLVRTTARLVDLYQSAEALPTPHLLLDVAYDHTVSLGPLVFPGETACLACLAGRINHLWGDPEPPARPAVLHAAPLAAALAMLELEKIAGREYGLANATVAYDLDSRRVAAGKVYRLPWCPVCGDGGESGGIIDLPWANAA